MSELNESLVESARLGSGLDTVYRALDRLVDLFVLDDAAVVVDVPGFARQVLHAGRRPLRDDEHGLHAAAPGLYLFDRQGEAMTTDGAEAPAPEASALAELMVALGALGLRHDARPVGEPESRPSGAALRHRVHLGALVNLDELELAVRRLRGVVSVGFVDDAGALLVEVHAGAEAYAELPRDISILAAEHVGGPVAVEVVRWGDGGPHDVETRLRLEELTTDPAAGELIVRLARGDETALGRAVDRERPARRGRGDRLRHPRVSPRPDVSPGMGEGDRDDRRPPVPRGGIGHRSSRSNAPPRCRRRVRRRSREPPAPRWPR